MRYVFYLFVAVSIAAVVTTTPTAAETPPGHYGYLEFGLSRQNTDFADFDDSTAGTVLVGVPVTPYVHFTGRLHEGNVHLPRGLVQERWWTYGAGLHHYFTRRTSAYIGAEHNELETDGRHPTQRGWEYHIGVRHDLTDRIRLLLQVGENDTVFADTTFTVEGLYQLPFNLAASARIRDYDDLDLTEYELGLRWQFDTAQ